MTIILSKKDIIKLLKKTHRTDEYSDWCANITRQSCSVYINLGGFGIKENMMSGVDEKTEKLIQYAFVVPLSFNPNFNNYNFIVELTNDGNYELTSTSSLI